MSNAGAGDKLHLLAFVTGGDAQDAIREAMQQQAGARFEVQPGDAATAAGFLESHQGAQVLMVEVPSAEAAPALLDALADRVAPDTRVIVTGKIDSIRFHDWLMELGIHDYLLQPFTSVQLVASMNRQKGGAVKTEAPARDKKLIALIGARGGVGTTSIATALAATVARTHQSPTLLLDLDAHFGSLALSLDLEPGHGTRDIWEKPERVDSLYLERTLVRPFSGFALLSAEEQVSNPIVLHPAAGEQLLAASRENYDVIFVDVPRQITPLSLHILAHADKVLIVMEPNVLGLRDALRIKDHMVESLKRPAPLLVLNREGLYPKSQLTHTALSKHTGLPIALAVAFNEEIAAATARGEILLDNPKLKQTMAPLAAFADTLLGKGGKEVAKPKRGFLRGAK